MIRRPPRSTLSSSSAASDVYKRQVLNIMIAIIVIIGLRIHFDSCYYLYYCSDSCCYCRSCYYIHLCQVSPGDMLFTPAGWWHSTLNPPQDGHDNTVTSPTWVRLLVRARNYM
eukprot:TRINITY_DN1599_c0_g1_i6.p1 TRINITY_DN1599_c0_g1~~TRINITY_DN1599_c0_g1_i6.p1  ORF type:complete len:113 (-),score=2.31 TRINITY_DN1599_c0_g1_i6:389-727(-)